MSSSDYLDGWEADWETRRDWDPEAVTRAWELREQGWSYAEIADRAGVTVAEAYRMIAAARAYEETPDPITTMGHLLTTVTFNLAHAMRHTKSALDSSGAERQFNLEHVDHHLAEVSSHLDHLTELIKMEYPKVGKAYDEIFKDIVLP